MVNNSFNAYIFYSKIGRETLKSTNRETFFNFSVKLVKPNNTLN